MSGRILALVDGSTYSDSVCRHAAWLASRLGSTVDLLHALDPRGALGNGRSGDHSAGPWPDEPDGSPEPSAEWDARSAPLDDYQARAVLDLAGKTVQRGRAGIINQRLWAGDLRANVARFVDEFAGQTRAVVMGRSGRTGDGVPGADDVPARLGSHVERIVRASREPVLVVPRSFRPVARVALAVDASTAVQRLGEHLTSSPVFRDLPVSVVHAGELTADLATQFEETCRGLQMAGLDVRAEVVPGEPAAVLRQVIEREGIDLLVMGAYGHSRLRHLVVGSTTTAILEACEVPILLVR